MKKTRVFSLFLAVALCLTAAGCKKSDPTVYSYWESDYEVVGGNSNSSGGTSSKKDNSSKKNNSSSGNAGTVQSSMIGYTFLKKI